MTVATANVPLYALSVAPDTIIFAPGPRLCGNLQVTVTVVPDEVIVSTENDDLRFEPVLN